MKATRRRGTVAVVVAVLLTAMLSFAALAIDTGIICAAKADLQKLADAAALAGASQLANVLEAEAAGVTVLDLAKTAIREITAGNPVMGHDIDIADEDIAFGTSEWDDTLGRFVFAPSSAVTGITAVRVTTRRTAATNGSLKLTFAAILGQGTKDVSAAATAVLVPRDIMVVADLSGSYNDDSELRHYDKNDPIGINLFEIWKTMPISSVQGALLQAWLDSNPGLGVQDAPTAFFRMQYGLFSQLGSTAVGASPVFGTETVNSSYNPSTDSGLIHLGYRTSWTTAALGSQHTVLRNFLAARGYNAAEVNAILADTGNNATNTTIRDADANSVSYTSDYSTKRRYDFRVAVALGLVDWQSGIPGGRWSTVGATPGNVDVLIGSSELVTAVPYPYPGGNWFEYAAYMRDSNNSNAAVDALPAIQNRFGVKTFLNFLLEEKESFTETDTTHYAMANPLNITKTALDVLMDDIAALDSDDRVGLVTYGAYSLLEYPLPAESETVAANTTAVKRTYRQRQAAHYSPSTNIGGALELGGACLDPSFGAEGAADSWGPVDLSLCHPRPWARKIIVLLTDGIANVEPTGSYTSGSGGKDYAVRAAQALWNQSRIYVHAVGVGSGADMPTLDSVVEAGRSTEHGYWANGDVAQIESELTQIFRRVGGARPVQLIE